MHITHKRTKRNEKEINTKQYSSEYETVGRYEYSENRYYGNNIVPGCVQDWIIYIYEGIRIVLYNEAIHDFSAHQTLLGRHESRRMRTAVEISDVML